MFKKFAAFGIILVGVIAGFVFAHHHHHHGHHKYPVVELNLSGLKALFKSPPIPIVKLPPYHMKHHHHHHHSHKTIPFISLPYSDHHEHGHHHHEHKHLKLDNLLNSIIGGNSWDSWDSWA